MVNSKSKILLRIAFMAHVILFSIHQTSFANGIDSSANEFKEYKEDTITSNINLTNIPVQCSPNCERAQSGIDWTAGILVFTVMAGIFIRFKTTRQLRSLFLVSSIVVLGFYRGACPCPIRSLQHLFLMVLGQNIKWGAVIYVTALIPITYFLGRVFADGFATSALYRNLFFLLPTLNYSKTERHSVLCAS